MKKKCYSLTFLGTNSNGGNDYRINSTIWLSADISSGLVAEEIAGFAAYVEAEIRRVWSTATNPGLSAGLGPFRYNRTNDTFTCESPPTFLMQHPRDTGVVVADVSSRDNPIIRDSDLQQNEILFTLFRTRMPGKKAFIDPKKQKGELYTYAPTPLIGITPGVAVTYNPVGQAWYEDVHNTASHEFGHALGLKDRYHYLAFGYQLNKNGNSDGSTSRNWISRHAGGDVPMYLPGIFDSRRSNYNSMTTPPGFNESAPPYNQPVYLDPTNSAIPPAAGASNPQPDFNPALSAGDIATLYTTMPEDHRGPYDIEYTTLFGWQHNIMSRRFGVNDPGGMAASNRFTGQYAAMGADNPLPAEPLYATIYAADAAGPTEVVLITKTQTDVIIDRGSIPLPLPSAGGEIISRRFEDKIAEANGFPTGMFDQFCFILYHGETFGSVSINVPDYNLGLRAASPQDLNGAGGVNDLNKKFYNKKSGGTFLGIHYVNKLNSRGEDNGSPARIVTDWAFDNPTTPQYSNILGVTDCMDYRMSKVLEDSAPTSSDLNRWEPVEWQLLPSLDNFLGFINPNISAKVTPKSKGRPYLTGKANIINRIKNIELDNLSESFFTGFPTWFQQSFVGGQERINALVVAFGSIDALRFLQRLFEQVRNPNSRFIIDGQFRSKLQSDGKINFAEKVGDDLFADCGIATDRARSIWNAWRTDRLPRIPNPWTPPGWMPAPGSAPGANPPPDPYMKTFSPFPAPDPTYNLPTNIGGTASTLLVTPWIFRRNAEHGKYIIEFTSVSPPATPIPLNNSQLKPKYELIIRHFCNRLIIDTICAPS